MSDQPDAPPKPKVGSLRDRIAAFEKSATSAAPPTAPAPRPKPAGFATWKPKVPSPPSSPAVTATTTSSDDRAASASASSKAGGMSASDAKESITKGGSLKDRMAALQGKGGFGAPPVVAPKPPMEKPKWKPPPVVHAPVDDDSQLTEGVSIAAAVERTISPPASIVSRESHEGQKIGEGEERATSPPTGAPDNAEEAGTADPEEEERQRRAAIAARMARLGGARVGMAPPVFGKKPPVRRPTQEEPPHAPEEHKPTEELVKSASNSEIVKQGDVPAPSPSNVLTSSPPGDSGATEDTQDIDRPAPARKNSESASISAADSDSHATKAPTSMPVPAVPRRAGPPRKKPAKPTAPAPDAPGERAVIAEEPSASSEEAKVHEPSSMSPTPAEVEQSFEQPRNETTADVLESTSHVATPVPVLHVESLKPDSDNVISDENPKSPQELSSKTSSVGTPLEEGSGIASPPPTLNVSEASEDASNGLNDEDEVHNNSLLSEIVPHHHPEPLTEPAVVQKVDEKLTEVSTPVADQYEDNDDEEDEDEAEARRKRVAARLAEMGAVNPLSMPPQVISVTEEMRSPPASTPADMSSHESNSAPERPADIQTPPSPKAADPIQPGISSESLSEVDEDQSVHEDYHERQYESLPSTTTKHHPETNSGNSHLSPAPLDGDNSSLYAEQSEQDSDSGSEYEEYSVHPTHPADDVAPLSHAEASSPEPSLPPARSAQPPMRILPSSSQVSDEEYEEEPEEAKDEDDDSGLQPHLFVPPPTERAQRNNIPAQRQSSADDEDESENGPPPLPYLQRRSVEVPAARSPSPPSDYASERESDHDGPALPVPAPVTSPKLTSDKNLYHQRQSIPQTSDTEPRRLAPPARRPIPATPPDEPVSQNDSPATSPVPLPRLSLSTSDNEEVLDEEEGDPIDPGFYSPSRRTSSVSLQALAQSQATQATQQISPSSVPAAPETQAGEDPQDAEQLRRQTIAERMAKLGGIKFGAAPVPVPRSQPPVAQEEQQDSAQHASQEEATPEAMSEEEEERARKERIAAKMANMGGMRIGMMPMGMGGFSPRPPIPQTNSYDSKPPARAIPPTRPPPPPAAIPDADSDHGSESVSEDAVKVEAELSETDEVDYAEADIPEETPPPIPSRSNRGAHRQDTSSSASSPPMSSRPPVPAGLPHRRSSVQTTRSMTGSSTGGEVAPATTPLKSSGFMPSSQSEYVMVEEPEPQEEVPPPPARPAGRAPPSRAAPQAPPAPPPTQTSTDASDSISSQWEIPSIPGIVSALDFGGDTDLSLSWTDAGEDGVTPAPIHSATSPPASPPAVPAQKAAPSDIHLSADELMALWGRVGVQVCEVATSLFEKSKKALIGDGTYAGFVQAVLALVPNAAAAPTAGGQYGYLVYMQNGPAVQKRASEIMPGDIVEIQDAKLKGHKGLQTYHQSVGGTGEVLVGVIGEFEAKKTKIRVFHANQHVGQQTVESVSYRLEDLKSGLVKVYRVLEA